MTDTWRQTQPPTAEVAHGSAFIHNVTFDASDPRMLGRFWSQLTGYAVVDDRDDFVRLRAPAAHGIRQILFLRVDDPTPGKIPTPNPDDM